MVGARRIILIIVVVAELELPIFLSLLFHEHGPCGKTLKGIDPRA
jgi:hypothetical protein